MENTATFTPFDELPHDAQLERMNTLALAAVANYDLHADSAVRLLNYSENYTYLVTCPLKGKHILRVNRPGYHTDEALEAELTWLDSLMATDTVVTARAIRGRDGERLQSVRPPGVDEPRRCVLFEFLPGSAPDEENGDTIPGEFEQLGRITAKLHNHVQNWPEARQLSRPVWDFEHTIGNTPNWGHWKHSLGMTPEIRDIFSQTVDLIKKRLEAYGTGPDNFGLIHADLRLANLLVNDGEVQAIDFDDCGFGWFMYDFASAVSFIEDNPILPELRRSWLKGYIKERPLSERDIDELPTFIMLRRLLLTGWLTAHAETETAQQIGPDRFTWGTAKLAREFLDRP
jgi:Ser/Thr protein kinase RdoA (MazF antagonist)